MRKLILTIIHILAFSSVFWACSSDTDAVKEAENEVFAIHDEVMPKVMGDMDKLKKRLNRCIVSIDSLKAMRSGVVVLRLGEEKDQVVRLLQNLTYSNELMNAWMSHYNGDTLAKLSSDQALTYLTTQKDQINDVKERVNSSIEQANRYLSKFKLEQPNNQPIQLDVKLKAFNSVSNLQDALSKNGIGSFRSWHKDEISWMSATDYFSFGSESVTNSTPNNLAYYLESDNESYVRSLKIILNIFNESQKNQAITIYQETAEKTFGSVNLEVPKGLLDAIKNQKEYQYDTPNFSVSNKLEKSKIDTWKLTIETK